MTDFGPRLTRDPRWYALYFLQTAAYLGLAFGHIGWALRKAGFASPATRNKLAAIFIALLITMAAWLSTNAYNSLTQAGGVPPPPPPPPPPPARLPSSSPPPRSPPTRGPCASSGTGSTRSSANRAGSSPWWSCSAGAPRRASGPNSGAQSGSSRPAPAGASRAGAPPRASRG